MICSVALSVLGPHHPPGRGARHLRVALGDQPSVLNLALRKLPRNPAFTIGNQQVNSGVNSDKSENTHTHTLTPYTSPNLLSTLLGMYGPPDHL